MILVGSKTKLMSHGHYSFYRCCVRSHSDGIDTGEGHRSANRRRIPRTQREEAELICLVCCEVARKTQPSVNIENSNKRARSRSYPEQALIRDLSQSVAPADNDDGVHPARDSWVLKGQFVEVDTGNGAMQAGVGFGAGQSQLEVHAKV